MNGKFLLIEVEERNISEPMFFDTLEEAQEEMAKRFSKALGIDHCDKVTLDGGDYEGYDPDDPDTAFREMQAYCETYGNNYDWKIFQLA